MEWSDKYLLELKKTILMKNECLELREEFDAYQSERLALGSAVLLLGRALLSSRINIVLVGSSSQQAPANHMSTSGGW